MLKKVLLIIALLGIGTAIGYFAVPSKVVEKEIIKYQEKVVEKKVYIKDTKKKNNKVTIKFVTIKPDGTKTIETKTYDNSVIEITKNGQTDTNSETTIDSTKEKVVEHSKNDLLINILAKTSTKDLGSLSYGGQINKRLLGPVYIGVFGFSDVSFGGSIGVGF